jgi:hypothetical protein
MLGCSDAQTSNTTTSNGIIATNPMVTTIECHQCKHTNALVHIAKREPPVASYAEWEAFSLCEGCAREFFRSAPERQELTFCADWREGEDQKQVRRRYLVLENAGGNRTRVNRLYEGTEKDRSEEFFIRTDLVSINSRTKGTEFAIVGTPLEIELIEHSAQ